MLADCYNVVAEHKTIGAGMRDEENVPAAVRRALDAMQVATQGVLNTDGHRRLLRHEGNAFAGRFGACAIFTTPKFPQQRHATFLLTRAEAEEPDFSLEVEHPDLGLLGDMKKHADDPVGLALAFVKIKMVSVFFGCRVVVSFRFMFVSATGFLCVLCVL